MTHHTAESYSFCTMCIPFRQCDYAHLSSPEQPCWGRVMITEDFGVEGNIHACEGHEAIWQNVSYIPEVK